jgi:outer membrane protein OmpA-like peptidoglycan-associated protein
VSLKLLGYADFLGDPSHNKILSQKRVDAVKNYLLEKYPSIVSIASGQAFGEKFSQDNHSKEGELSQRRVDVIVEKFIQHEKPALEEKPAPQKQKPVTKKEPPKPAASDLGKMEKGKTITLEGLSFIPGRHYIVKGSMPVLEKLLQTLRDNPELKIEIQGHVCCDDGRADGMDYDTHQWNLSESRAKAVYDYLVKNGIDSERLSYKGYGHTHPKISPETSPEDEQVNRRVEILVLEDE